MGKVALGAWRAAANRKPKPAVGSRVRAGNFPFDCRGERLHLWIQVETNMLKLINKFRRDEEGASLIEYSLLIGLITVAAVASIALMGPWVAQQWSALVSATGA